MHTISVSHCAFDLFLLIIAAVGWKKAVDATRESDGQAATWEATAQALKDELTKVRAKAGFTIIELLIVIAIAVILLGLVAVSFQSNVESRRTREAARAINTYLGSGRNRAMESGRPCGVTFRRLQGLPCSMVADQCEVPPTYSGETEDARVQVIATGANTARARFVSSATVLPPWPQPPIPTGLDALTPRLVRPGDLMQLNHQGPLYRIVSGNGTLDADGFFNADNSVIELELIGAALMPWQTEWYVDEPDPTDPQHVRMIRAYVQPVAYRVHRAPVKGYAQPLQLPAGAVVDLSASGVGTNFFGASEYTILFSSTGAVKCIYIDGNRQVVIDPIYLLVGKRERIGNVYIDQNPDESTLTNFQDLNNRWVTVNCQTGAIQTEPVAAIPAGLSESDAIVAARALARTGEGMGGR